MARAELAQPTACDTNGDGRCDVAACAHVPAITREAFSDLAKSAASDLEPLGIQLDVKVVPVADIFNLTGWEKIALQIGTGCHAIDLGQEAGDAVHTRGAGHPLDGERHDLDAGRRDGGHRRLLGPRGDAGARAIVDVERGGRRIGHIPPGAAPVQPDGRSTTVIRPPYIPIEQE